MKALAIVDCQKDFIDGSMGVGSSKWKPVQKKILGLIKSKEYDTLIVTADEHPANHCSFKYNGGQWPVHCVINTDGSEFDAKIAKAIFKFSGNVIIEAKGENPNKEEYGVDLLKFDSDNMSLEDKKVLENIDQVDVVGLCYDYCVAECAKMTSIANTNVKVRILKDATVAIRDSYLISVGHATIWR